MLYVPKQLYRALRTLAEQENQTRHAYVACRVKLQLHVGQLRTIGHWRAVPETYNSHENISAAHRFLAHLRWRQRIGREVSHINWRTTGSDDRRLRCSHE